MTHRRHIFLGAAHHVLKIALRPCNIKQAMHPSSQATMDSLSRRGEAFATRVPKSPPLTLLVALVLSVLLALNHDSFILAGQPPAHFVEVKFLLVWVHPSQDQYCH
jgi:hypothetical protein